MNAREIGIMLISFVAGCAAGKILDSVWNKMKGPAGRIKNSSVIKALEQEKPDNIMRMVYVGRCGFNRENINTQVNDEKDFFLAFPDELRKELAAGQETFKKEDIIPPNGMMIPGYSREVFNTLLESARREIAQKFISTEDGMYFNSAKLGVSYSDGNRRTADAQENPILSLELFHTDYFTERVVGQLLKWANLSELDKQTLNGSLSWSRASFGLSVLVILRSCNEIIMTRRAKNAAFTENKEWIYVSATESLAAADGCGDAPALEQCLKRGIEEELGITREMIDESSIRFYSTFYEKNFHQDNIVASVELKENVEKIDILNLSAKDRELEISQISFIKNSPEDIKKFIENNRDDMRSQTVFSLMEYAERME